MKNRTDETAAAIRVYELNIDALTRLSITRLVQIGKRNASSNGNKYKPNGVIL